MAAKELVENKKLGYTCNFENHANMIDTLERIYNDWGNDDLPAYTLSDIIEDSILSVISQTYTNWELIVIDDNSRDCSRKGFLKK